MKVVKQLGIGYDSQVLEWKAMVEASDSVINSIDSTSSESDDEWVTEDEENETDESSEVTIFSSTGSYSIRHD